MILISLLYAVVLIPNSDQPFEGTALDQLSTKAIAALNECYKDGDERCPSLQGLLDGHLGTIMDYEAVLKQTASQSTSIDSQVCQRIMKREDTEETLQNEISSTKCLIFNESFQLILFSTVLNAFHTHLNKNGTMNNYYGILIGLWIMQIVHNCVQSISGVCKLRTLLKKLDRLQQQQRTQE